MPTTRLADLSTPDDSSAVVRLLTQYADDPAIGSPGLGEKSKQNVVADLASREFARVYFAIDDTKQVENPGHFIGLAICFEMYSTFTATPTLNVHDFMIDAPWRGRGLGTQLMRAVIDDARHRGCGSVTLEVYEGNTIARSAYEKVGFRNPQADPELGKTLYLSNRLAPDGPIG